MTTFDIPRTHHLDKRSAHLDQFIASGDPDQLLSTKQVAELIGMSVSWLEIGRCAGFGPPFLKLGPRMVKYRRADLVRWIRSRKARVKR
jgi:predicted DNA-binding transcriptional regulator AlpA